ncbi:hypothetical protein ABB37_03296 [Leptomonas pyrrhocoris]|uniref:Uncharacterized protein n=1 Tax=Leptomonas pyrrhocoris TaxID=157538 RepID=A0A0M9G4N3_LEPPY|nr:hypothetical protein ABB37_03296 [Leptomonas pyrrhocoris]KPA82167.1 hypothetical protein ABB37_03296 [Leptomonas pyrrhocoris]|eukprot:XP_015660606.1 hypothetical protein ABB37_03296 [Leptomonas pyrrhocoris]
MSARMQVPLSQRRHTNIAVVRYSKNGVKLEVACYKNKVISYRSGTETRLDEVLQVERIFTSVARGHLASEKDVEAVFGPKTTEQEAIKFMLDHGELQVAQQERTAEVDEMFKDIAIIISQKCVSTKTQHPFPAQVIEQALRSIGAAVKLDQPVKKQALGLIRSLIDADIIPIARANMKIRCTTTSAEALDKLRAWCSENDAEVVEKDLAAAAGSDGRGGGAYSLLFVMQPSLFRDLDTFVKEKLPPGSTTHMVDAAVSGVGDDDVVLDANAVSKANAHHGRDEASGGNAAPTTTTTSASSATGGVRGASRKVAASSDEKDTDQASSMSNNNHHRNVDDAAASGGRRRKQEGGGKGGKKDRGGRHSSDESDDSDGDAVPLMERARKHTERDAATVAAAPKDDLTAELLKLRVDDGSDDEDGGRGGGRGGKGKRSKKNAAGGAAKKGTSAPPPMEEDEDEGGRKGKNKNKNKKKKAAATVPEKEEPEVKEEFSESDEELLVNRKQRAKKQHQQGMPNDANNWNDEEDFEYGEEEDEQA